MHPPCGLDLRLFLCLFCLVYVAQVVVQILVSCVVVRHILNPIPEHLFQILIGSLPCLVVVEKATYSGVWVEQLLGF